MNARQKAKKYKKELDHLKGLPPIKVVRTEMNLEHVKAGYTISNDMAIALNDEELLKIVRSELSHRIMQYVSDKLLINCEDDLHGYGKIFSSEVWIGFHR